MRAFAVRQAGSSEKDSRRAPIERKAGQAHALRNGRHHREEIWTTGQLGLDNAHAVIHCFINKNRRLTAKRVPVNMAQANRRGASREAGDVVHAAT
jgi:hypothetical protein